MAIIQKGKCDECGKEFSLTNGCYGIEIIQQESKEVESVVSRWTIVVYADLEAIDTHVCGKACLLKRIDKAIGG